MAINTSWAGGPDGSGEAADLANFTPNDALFPDTDPAGALSRNGHPYLSFDATTPESVTFVGNVGDGYQAGDVFVDIDTVAASAIVGDFVLGIEVEGNKPGGTDIDSDSFATPQQTGKSTTSGTSGIITRTTIKLSNAQADSLVKNSKFRLRLQRVADDGDDDMAGDLQVLFVAVRQ